MSWLGLDKFHRPSGLFFVPPEDVINTPFVFPHAPETLGAYWMMDYWFTLDVDYIVRSTPKVREAIKLGDKLHFIAQWPQVKLFPNRMGPGSVSVYEVDLTEGMLDRVNTARLYCHVEVERENDRMKQVVIPRYAGILHLELEGWTPHLGRVYYWAPNFIIYNPSDMLDPLETFEKATKDIFPIDEMGRLISEQWRPDLPDMKYYDTIAPTIIPAGETFVVHHQLYNYGEAGSVKMWMKVDEQETASTFFADKPTASPTRGGTMDFSETLEMPWDDVRHDYSIELSSVIEPWLEVTQISITIHRVRDDKDVTKRYGLIKLPDVITDSKSFDIPITAGFPQASLGFFSAPESLKPGDPYDISFPVSNLGARGDVGISILSAGFSSETSRRVDSGDSIVPQLQGEMPAIESLRVTAVPWHLGRYKAKVYGEERVVEIKPKDAIMQWLDMVSIRGGGDIIGFVAGKNLEVTGIRIEPSMGGPPFLKSPGYIFSTVLGPEDLIMIKFEELYYIRVETGKEVAIGRRGTLIDRAVKMYEYSCVPTPSMLSFSIRALGATLTKRRQQLRVS